MPRGARATLYPIEKFPEPLGKHGTGAELLNEKQIAKK